MSELPRVLIDERRLEARVAELAREIGSALPARPLTLVGVLKGALFFLADLARQLPGDVRCELLSVSSYLGATSPQHEPRIEWASRFDIKGQQLVLVEDIADTGRTLLALQRMLAAESPASLHTCVLLDKRERRQVAVGLDWVGFEIPDRFVVGYGLDHRERYRGLPYIGVLDPP